MAKRVSRRRRQGSSSKKNAQQQQFLLIGGGALAALVVFGLVVLLNQSQVNTEVCDYDDKECYGDYLNVPDQGTTEEGLPYIGSSEAPIIIAEFSNFLCSHCKDYSSEYKELIKRYATENQAQFRYMPLHNTEQSEVAAEAAVCAAEQDAFWPYHEELFELSGTTAFDRDMVVDLADDMNLDKEAFEKCLNSSTPLQALTSARLLSNQLGITGTPTLAYSLDGGETWVKMETRAESTVTGLIEGANATGTGG